MVDLETLDIGPRSVVVSIGAVKFDLKTGKLGSQYHAVLNIQEQINMGRTISADTLRWWMKQSKEARDVFSLNEQSVSDVLTGFEKFFVEDRSLFLWGNGAGFDPPILDSLFKDFGYDTPWKYWNVNDVRTVKRFFGHHTNILNLGISHNALDDAITQANYVIEHIRKRK